MSTDISKSRIRRIVRLRRQRLTRKGASVPFRDGTPLAVVYLGLVVAAALVLSLRVPGSVGAPAPGRPFLQTVLSNFGVLCAAVACGRLMLGQLAPEVLARNSRISMLGFVAVLSDLLCVGVVVAGRRLFPFFRLDAVSPEACWPLLGLLLPYAFAPTLSTLLAGPGAGMSIGLALAVQNVLFLPPAAGVAATLTGVLAALAAPLVVVSVHRRWPLVVRMGAIGLVEILALLVMAGTVRGFLSGLWSAAASSPDQALRVSGVAGAFCALALFTAPFAVLLLLAPFEHLFGACSAIRLDVWADLSQPLLRRLSLEAPGTFHHSLMVANLASAAAEAVGADPLLARVGSYYHDVGKLVQPGKFTENIGFGGVNPHDSLQPAMSAIILSAHVKDGTATAKAENLPEPVLRIIAEHHGTSTMAFFLDKARRLAEKGAAGNGEAEPVDENQFRYAGPRPTSAESAIVMLADSAEAASRSLPNPVPSAIEKRVDAVVSAKMQDGQLDDSPLTCADVVVVRRVFASVLATALHGRVVYPKAPEEGASRAAAAAPGPDHPAPANAPS